MKKKYPAPLLIFIWFVFILGLKKELLSADMNLHELVQTKVNIYWSNSDDLWYRHSCPQRINPIKFGDISCSIASRSRFSLILRNISTPTWWISTKLFTDIRGPQRMYPLRMNYKNFVNFLTFHLFQHHHLSNTSWPTCNTWAYYLKASLCTSTASQRH